MGKRSTSEPLLEARLYAATNPWPKPGGLERILEAIERHGGELTPLRAHARGVGMRYSREAIVAARDTVSFDFVLTRSRMARSSFLFTLIAPRGGVGMRIDVSLEARFFGDRGRGESRRHEFIDLMASLAESCDASYGFAHDLVDFMNGQDPHRKDTFAPNDVYEAYWVNVYGREMVDRLGRAKVETAPALEIRELSNEAVMLVTDVSPLNFAAPDARATQARYLAHFGRELHRENYSSPPNSGTTGSLV